METQPSALAILLRLIDGMSNCLGFPVYGRVKITAVGIEKGFNLVVQMGLRRMERADQYGGRAE